MGAGASTMTPRRLTVRNDDPRIIQVSEDVVRRLKSTTASAAEPSGSQKTQETREEPKESQYSQVPQPPNVAPAAPVAPRYENLVLGFSGEGQTTIETVSALDVRKQKEAELRANDKFWREKLRDIEARYIKAEFDAGEEFSKQLSKLSALVPEKGEEKCKVVSTKVAECYRAHPTETLKCSELVKQFAKCVEQGNALT